MNIKFKNKLKELREFSSDHLREIDVQTKIINRMVETVNHKTRLYQNTDLDAEKRLLLASDIHDANIQILNMKYEFLMKQIQDVYHRIDGTMTLLESVATKKL